MGTLLSQNTDGSWKLSKIKHNKDGLVITGATVSYKGKQLNLPAIKKTQTTVQLETGWVTKVGMSDSEVLEMQSEINASFAPNPYISGNTAYTVVANFTCNPYIPVEPTHEYSLMIVPSETAIDSVGTVALEAYFVTDGVLPGELVTNQAAWSIVSGRDYATVGNSGAKKGVVTGSNETDTEHPVTVKAAYTYEGETYEATAVVRVGAMGEINTSTTYIEFECDENELYSVTVAAGNVGWAVSVTNGTAWLSVQNKTDNGFKVKVLDNGTGEDRTGKITVSPLEEGAANSVEIQVKQKKCAVIEFINAEDLETDCDNLGPFVYTVSASDEWRIVDDPRYQWIHATKNGNTLSVTLDRNDGDDRTGEVSVCLVNNQTVKDTIHISQLKCVPQTTPEITITLTSSNTIPLTGGTVTATITVTDGTFTNISMNPGNGISYVVNSRETNGNVETVMVTFTVQSANQARTFDIIAYGEDEYGQTCNDKTTIVQVMADWILSDVDYVLFTYVWGAENGEDLDSFTFVDGIPEYIIVDGNRTKSCLYENGVGYSNGKDAPGSSGLGREKWVGPDYENAILKFAGDNTKTGGEYTLVDLRNLNAYIKSLGEQQENSKVIIYLMGSWYKEKVDGKAQISFTAYTGGEMYRDEIESDKFSYVPSSDCEFKESRTVSDVLTFAASHSTDSNRGIPNAANPLGCYTTMAAMVYDLETGVLYLVTGDGLKNGQMFSERYSYGLESYFTGQWRVVDANGAEATSTYNLSSTVHPVADLTGQREYTATVNASFNAYTGSTPTQPHSTQITIENPFPDVEYNEATVTPINDKSFKVRLTGTGKFYGSDYRVKFVVRNPDNDPYMAQVLPKTQPAYSVYLDINEKSEN